MASVAVMQLHLSPFTILERSFARVKPFLRSRLDFIVDMTIFETAVGLSEPKLRDLGANTNFSKMRCRTIRRILVAHKTQHDG